MAFIVKNIVNENTIEVSPGWKWGEHKGNLVSIAGYTPPNNEQTKVFTKIKLDTLVKNKEIELKNATSAIGTTIHCSVYLNEVDISKYFPELNS
jgi:hypothetical protein